MEKIVQVRREPFARGDVVRQAEQTERDCHWCGQRRRSGKLFRYGWWSDVGRITWDDCLFCGLGCRSSYYD